MGIATWSAASSGAAAATAVEDFPRGHMILGPSDSSGRILSGLLMLLGVKANGTEPALQADDDRAVLANRITPGCDFYQSVAPGDKFYIYSPNYPETFSPHLTCRW
jgi:hypothetical protein